MLPSQWMSILLRYVERTSDDFKSFVSFLNLPNSDPPIDVEKLQVILAGISEMTENFEQQRDLVQTIVQRKFDGILEKGIKEEELLERTKVFAKNELDKKMEEIATKHKSLEGEFKKHQLESSETIVSLTGLTSEQSKKIQKQEEENATLKEALRRRYVKNIRYITGDYLVTFC